MWIPLRDLWLLFHQPYFRHLRAAFTFATTPFKYYLPVSSSGFRYIEFKCGLFAGLDKIVDGLTVVRCHFHARAEAPGV
ncbi:hypothetical protein D3C86_1737420 [compost metagenome]